MIRYYDSIAIQEASSDKRYDIMPGWVGGPRPPIWKIFRDLFDLYLSVRTIFIKHLDLRWSNATQFYI